MDSPEITTQSPPHSMMRTHRKLKGIKLVSRQNEIPSVVDIPKSKK